MHATIENAFPGIPYSPAFGRAYKQALAEGPQYAALLAYGRMANPAIDIVRAENYSSDLPSATCSVGALLKAFGILEGMPAPDFTSESLGLSPRSWSAIMSANDGGGPDA